IDGIGCDLDQVAIGILAIDRGHRSKSTAARGRAGDGNAAAAEAVDHRPQTAVGYEAKIQGAGGVDLGRRPAGIAGLAQVDLVLSEFERDPRIRSGRADVGLAFETEGALVPYGSGLDIAAIHDDMIDAINHGHLPGAWPAVATNCGAAARARLHPIVPASPPPLPLFSHRHRGIYSGNEDLWRTRHAVCGAHA